MHSGPKFVVCTVCVFSLVSSQPEKISRVCLSYVPKAGTSVDRLTLKSIVATVSKWTVS